MGSVRRLIAVVIGFLVISNTARTQERLGWRIYRSADGLAQSACASVSFTPQGTVLVRHPGRRASVLDGYEVRVLEAPSNAVGRITASPSGQIWTAIPQGLAEWRGEEWISYPIARITAALRTGANTVPLLAVRQGRVLCLLPDGLGEFIADNPAQPRFILWRSAAEMRIGRFTAMLPASDGGLWISGTKGIARITEPIRNLNSSAVWQEYIPPPEMDLRNFGEASEDGDGILVVAERGEQQTIVRFDGTLWRLQTVPSTGVFRVWRGPEGALWAAGETALLTFNAREERWTGSEELPARRYLDVALEPEGRFWLATSDGLFRYSPPLWRSQSDSSVRALIGEDQGRLWALSTTRLIVSDSSGMREFPLPASALQNPARRMELHPLKDGEVLMISGDLWFRLSVTDGELVSHRIEPPVPGAEILGSLRNGNLCLAMNAGGTDSEHWLGEFDGSQLSRLIEVSPLNLGAIRKVFQSRNGDYWIGCDRGIAWWHEQRWRLFTSEDQTTPEAVDAFVQLGDDRLWCGAQNRVWEFDGKEWNVMRVGFEQVRELRRTRDGSVWVTSSAGLFRFSQNAWIEQGAEEGLAGAVHSVAETQDRLWAGTSSGLYRHYPSADSEPPKTFIRKLASDAASIPEGGTLNLLFNGRDKWKSTAPGRLLYSYRLDQHDWSPFQDLNAVSFPDLAAGKHYLQVRAMDRNANIEATPAQLEFEVELPWYRETRLVLATGFGVIAALFFAGLAWNRHERLRRSYAEVERKVAERTRQLEAANRELLHSQKMTALGTLAAGVAHDFNNILSIVKGSAQIIEDNLEKPDKVRTRVDRIKTVVEQGSGIVKAMLGFSRDSDGEPAWCEPNAVVNETLRLLGDRFQREVQVTFEPTEQLPRVSAPKEFIQQILLNFIFNAAEAMQEKRHITLATRLAAELPPGVVLAPAQAANYVIASVRDEGCGISPENLPRVFEPFFTTKGMSARRGTGLGLSMAYELARKMDAGLALESAVGLGSTFSLILPARENTPEPEAGMHGGVKQ